jgi:hypothetical protein
LSSDRSPESRGAPSSPPAPRLSLSELVRLQLDALTRTSGEHSSVELTRNAKGETQITVKVRTGDAGVETVDDAYAKARELYDMARVAYPSTSDAG